MNKHFIGATVLLAGTIIGAGIFSLPYVFTVLGFWRGVLYLVLAMLVYVAVHTMYAELIETRSGNHEFFFLAHTYLSPRFSKFASYVVFSGLILTLTIYLILGQAFTAFTFGEATALSFFIFWAVGTLFMFVRLSWLEWADFIGVLGILAIVLLVLWLGGMTPFRSATPRALNMSLALLPFGPLLFSFMGRSAIPEVVDEHRAATKEGRAFSLRRAIFWGTALPAAIYIIFVVGVIRLAPNVSSDALSSLTFLPGYAIGALGILGFITLITSYFMIGINVKNILTFDVRVRPWIAGFIIAFAPPALYLLGVKNFLSAVSFAGGIFVALESMFVVMMWQKAFPRRGWRWIQWPLYIVFLLAIGYEIARTFFV